LSTAPEHLLSSVALITEQRQLQCLAQSLIDTIVQTMGLQRVAVVNIGAMAHFPAVISSADFALSELPTCIKTCVASGQAVVESYGDLQRLALPISINDKVMKVLLVEQSQWSEQQQTMLRAFARIYENFARVVIESQTDGLTGLLNRKAFDYKLYRLFNDLPAADEVRQHWLLTFDIDFFKRINDSLGHLYGDEILLTVATAMLQSFDADDPMFRFGGDEFVILLANQSRGQVEHSIHAFTELLRSKGSERTGNLTLSLGCAALSRQDDPMSVMMKADRALYYAKEHGRDRAIFYADLQQRGEADSTLFTDDIELF